MVTKTKPTLDEVRQALRKVMEAPDTGFTAYAQTYALAALQMHMVDEEMRVQLLYVLNNLQQWRGEEARQTKSILKAYAKVK
mgnify:CR=1 FL=1